MPERRLSFDSGHLADLTVGQYRNLLDLAQLAITRTTIDALFPTLALRLHHALNLTLSHWVFTTQVRKVFV